NSDVACRRCARRSYADTADLAAGHSHAAGTAYAPDREVGRTPGQRNSGNGVAETVDDRWGDAFAGSRVRAETGRVAACDGQRNRIYRAGREVERHAVHVGRGGINLSKARSLGRCLHLVLRKIGQRIVQTD